MFNEPGLAKDGHKIKKIQFVIHCICRVYMYVHNTIFYKHDRPIYE